MGRVPERIGEVCCWSVDAKVILYDFAKHWLLPGSFGLFFLGLVLGLVASRFARTARLGTFALAVFIGGYGAMSMPMGAWLLGRLVSAGYSSPVERSELADIQAIVDKIVETAWKWILLISIAMLVYQWISRAF